MSQETTEQLLKNAQYYLDYFERGKRFYNLTKKEQSDFKALMTKIRSKTFTVD